MNRQQITRNLAKGWNHWDTTSTTAWVHLPSGFAIRLGLKEYRRGYCLRDPLIGLLGKDDVQIYPGAHSYDGSYTSQRLIWRDVELTLESAAAGEDYVIRITTLSNQHKAAALIVESAILWNRSGILSKHGNVLHCQLPDGQEFRVYATVPHTNDVWARASTPYLLLSTASGLGISTGRERSLQEIDHIVQQQRSAWDEHLASFGELSQSYAAMQNCMAWDTIYDPANDRVITPVSRNWSTRNGGYAMFCWDTYFGAFMAALDNRDLAFSNAIAITKDRTSDGFVPNCAHSSFISRDRSQPPVGSLLCLKIFKMHPETWFLEEIYDDLRIWSQWWIDHRMTNGLLCWGSDPYEPTVGNDWESVGVNDRYGAALESGLDNSPMYDDIPFDRRTHQLMLQDAGLNGLYIADCDALAEIADILGKTGDAEALAERASQFRVKIQELWDDDFSLFLNRRTDTGEFSKRISPTNFYPMLGKAATEQQARRMIENHFYNPDEFWGDWIMPSIARNDPAYPDQDYWRGRIWAPMNFLVYLGIKRYDLPKAASDLSKKSNQLILREWEKHRHVHENYCGDTGMGCNKENSDRFYHWGGLLAAIALMENGYFDNSV